MAEPLWICEECELIGSEFEAIKHQQVRGHVPRELSAELSDAVRTEQGRNSYWPTAADWIAFAEFKRRADAASQPQQSPQVGEGAG